VAQLHQIAGGGCRLELGADQPVPVLSPHRVIPGNTKITVPLARRPGSGASAACWYRSSQRRANPEQLPEASIVFSSRGGDGLRAAVAAGEGPVPTALLITTCTGGGSAIQPLSRHGWHSGYGKQGAPRSR